VGRGASKGPAGGCGRRGLLPPGPTFLLIVAGRAEARAVTALAQNRIGARFDAMAGQVVAAVNEALVTFSLNSFHAHGAWAWEIGTERLS